MLELRREDKIYTELRTKLRWLKENTDHKIVYIAIHGSQNYELDMFTEDYQSDYDAKAFVLPKPEDLVSNKKMVSKVYVMDDNSHIEVKDIRLLPELLRKANPAYLELLYTKFHIVVNPEFKIILDMADKIVEYNKFNLFYALRGTAMEKLINIDKEREGIRDVINKYGYDPKQLCHALRCIGMLEHIFVGRERFRDNLIPNENSKEFLKMVKLGFYSKEDALILANSLIDYLKLFDIPSFAETPQDKTNINSELEGIINKMVYNSIKRDFTMRYANFYELKEIKAKYKDLNKDLQKKLQEHGIKENEYVVVDLYTYYDIQNHWEI